MIYLGLDWAEDHHDIAVMAETGEVLTELRVDDTAAGVEAIHAAVAQHQSDPGEPIPVGTETAYGLVPLALRASGYQLYEINPLASSRYRDRHHLSGAKSDRGDAKMLADVVRTDRHNHRLFDTNSDISDSVKVLARAHQSLVHQRQTQINVLRSTLRMYYPGMWQAFPNLTSPSTRDCLDAMAVIDHAPTPEKGRLMSHAKIASALRKAGRKHSIDARATEVREILRRSQLQGHGPLTTRAYGSTARATARMIVAMSEQIAELGTEMNAHFEKHPDAKIILSLPGLGPVLGARVMGEFGDAPNRYADGRARKNYATTAPVTRASGKLCVVGARHGGNRILGDACLRWAFSAVRTSPGARRYYESLRKRDKTHAQAIRTVANRLVGILHGCLEHRALYSETIAWPQSETSSDVAA
ncbi:MAG: IS110 family transposase [Acidimicrobiales bacterium]